MECRLTWANRCSPSVLPLTTFRRRMARYGGEHKVKSLSCLDLYPLWMAFVYLTSPENLLAIQACLRARASNLYDLELIRK